MTAQIAVATLAVQGILAGYHGSEVLHGVSLDVPPGSTVVLLGPNGAGKSTLFQLLSGLFVADSGRIEVMGNDMSRNAVPALARLGIVFQQPTLDLGLRLEQIADEEPA